MAAENRELSPEEGRWIAKPLKPRGFLLPVFFPIIASQIFNWINLFGGTKSDSVILVVALSIPALLLVIAVAGYAANAARRRTRNDAPVVPDGAFGDQFEAYVTIVVLGKRLGSDRGIVWFAEGLMGFSGCACSFVLDADDIAPQAIASRRAPSRYTLPCDALVLRGAPKEAYVVVTALKGKGAAYRQRLKRFVLPDGSEDERLVQYVIRSQHRSEERQWPPFAPYKETKPLMDVAR